MRCKATFSLLMSIGLGFITLTLKAQDMHIYYNLFNDSIVYKMEGKVIEDPKLKNGQDIQFHFTEFNNFLYDLELEFKQEDVQSSSGIMAMASLACWSERPSMARVCSVSALGNTFMVMSVSTASVPQEPVTPFDRS